ncbi:MAG: hypothetical protein ABH888_00215 [Patescibacteria group bacterium]
MSLRDKFSVASPHPALIVFQKMQLNNISLLMNSIKKLTYELSIKLLSKHFKTEVKIITGLKGRNKIIEIGQF